MPARVTSARCFLVLQDLYKPDSTRLRRNLSGIINFAKFREEKLIPYTDLQESVEHLLEETAGLEEQNMLLVSRLQAQIESIFVYMQPILSQVYLQL